ncbi:hypothetical protein Tco_0915101 [Tanacetum coccineum]
MSRKAACTHGWARLMCCTFRDCDLKMEITVSWDANTGSLMEKTTAGVTLEGMGPDHSNGKKKEDAVDMGPMKRRTKKGIR